MKNLYSTKFGLISLLCAAALAVATNTFGQSKEVTAARNGKAASCNLDTNHGGLNLPTVSRGVLGSMPGEDPCDPRCPEPRIFNLSSLNADEAAHRGQSLSGSAALERRVTAVTPMSHAIRYSNRLSSNFDGANGWNWLINEWPNVVEIAASPANSVYVTLGSGDSVQFDSDGGSGYLTRPLNPDLHLSTLAESGKSYYVVTHRGHGKFEQLVLYDLNVTNNGTRAGKFKSYTDASGNVTQVTTWGTGDRIEEIRRVVADGGTTTTFSLLYGYVPSGANAGKIADVLLRKSIDNGSTWTDLIRNSYDYYGSSDANGSLNDLRRDQEEVYNGSWTTVGVRYYRYYVPSSASITRSGGTATVTVTAHGWSNGDSVTIEGASQSEYNGTFTISNVTTNTFDVTVTGSPATPATGTVTATKNGFAHALKYVVGAEGYRRLNQDEDDGGPDTSIDPLTATNTQIAGISDFYYEYGANQRVTKKVDQANCGGCGGGGGTTGDTYSNTTSGHSDGFNSWKTKIVKTRPDGNTETTYTNYKDQVMLWVLAKTGSGDKWYKFNKYNSVGQLILQAESSAITGYDDTKADLLDAVSGNYTYMSDSSGLIHVIDYYSSTGSGGVAGYIQYRKIKNGETASEIKLRRYEYTTRTENSVDLYLTSLVDVYTDASNDAIKDTTTYTYTDWHGGGANFKLKTLTTTLPTVTTAMNGSNSGSITFTSVYDTFGNKVWEKDGSGRITRTKWDAAAGTVIEKIVGVGTVSDSGIYAMPSGWSSISGLDQHLKTEMTYDNLGRLTQTLGPEHQAIDNSGTATTLRSGSWRTYAEVNGGTSTFVGFDENRSAAGYAIGTNTFAVGPATITQLDKAARTLDQIVSMRASNATLLTAAESLTDTSKWQSRRYQTFSDDGELTKSETYTDVSSKIDSDFVYDSMGRRTKETSAGKTITRKTFDPRGLVTKIEIGTDASGGGSDNMVTVEEYEYDGGSAGGNGNLTKVTRHEDGSTTRVTNYTYDFRNRRTVVDGEVDQYTVYTYDNLDRVIQVDRKDTNSGGNLIGRTVTKYDSRGRVYETVTSAVDPSTGTVGNALTAKRWYDEAGHLIKSIEAGAGEVFTKHVYDGAGRVTKTYAGYDASETAYADASTVTGDTILSQSESTYDEAANLILSTTRQRLHDATGTGELSTISGSQPKARVSYVAHWFDGAGRQLATANYGTNADSSVSRPSEPPTSSDTILVSKLKYDLAGTGTLAYNHGGAPCATVDPSGIETHSFKDWAGRLVKTIEAYNDGSFSTGNADLDRTTEYTYTADGKVASIVARNANTGDQPTYYVYGTTLSDSGVARKDLLRAVIYPDADDYGSGTFTNGTDGNYDRVEMKYNRLGELIERKDQNQTVHAYNYDKLGRMTHDRITSFGSGVDQTVKRVSRSYEVRGMLAEVSSYDNATVGSGSVVNEVELTYNTFGQLDKEYQANSGTVNTGTTPYVQYTYDSGAAGTLSTNQIRKTKLRYPNARELFYLYADAGDTPGISDKLNRVTSLSSASTRGTSDANVIVGYEFNGMGQLIRKDYPSPNLRLDYWGGTTGTYAGYDRFGRISSQNWVDYNSTPFDRFEINHGYDRDGNRLYADNTVYPGWSQMYTYDNLDRLTDEQQGQINSGKTAIESDWKVQSQGWTLDATGNQTAVSINGTSSYEEHTANKANEYTERKVKADAGKPAFLSDAYGSDTSANYTKVDGDDTFTVASGVLKVTGLGANSRCVLLMGENIAEIQGTLAVKFPDEDEALAGFVFGYIDSTHYWVLAFRPDRSEVRLLRANGGSPTVITGISYTPASNFTSFNDLFLAVTRKSIRSHGIDYTFADGLPAGKVGIYTDTADVEFDNLKLYHDAQYADLGGRWIGNGTDLSSGNAVSSDALLLKPDYTSFHKPILLRGTRVKRFETIFSAVRTPSDSTARALRFAFNATDQDDYDSILLHHADAGTVPSAGTKQINGALPTSVSAGSPSGSMPGSIGSSTKLWYRITHDGTNLKVYCQSGSSAPGSWSSSHEVYTSTGFRTSGGMIGLMGDSGGVSIDDLTVKADRDNNGSFEVTEHQELFGVTSSKFVQGPTHDSAGNLTFDGVFKYSYDGWNRMMTASKAYRDGSGTLQTGSTVATMGYDGKGRRITKAIANNADLDTTYVYYHDGDSVIETRNGSSYVLKQQVWGTQYIGELVQIGINQDPENADTALPDNQEENQCERFFYVAQDSNYNVLGVVYTTGVLCERYEYTPYGRRTTYSRGWINADLNDDGAVDSADADIESGVHNTTNPPHRADLNGDGVINISDFSLLAAATGQSIAAADPTVMHPRVGAGSFRGRISAGNPTPLCDVGHQGLMHDEEVDFGTRLIRPNLALGANNFDAGAPAQLRVEPNGGCQAKCGLIGLTCMAAWGKTGIGAVACAVGWAACLSDCGPSSPTPPSDPPDGPAPYGPPRPWTYNGDIQCYRNTPCGDTEAGSTVPFTCSGSCQIFVDRTTGEVRWSVNNVEASGGECPAGEWQTTTAGDVCHNLQRNHCAEAAAKVRELRANGSIP